MIMDIDFGKTAADYGAHRAGFPDALYNRLAGFGVGMPGQRLLDLGTGTGVLGRGFALRGCSVTGLDPSDNLIAEAQRLDSTAGVKIDYVTATAEETGLATDAFDVVTAGQCWHWFDGARAAAEARRILKPSGALIIAHFDWLPLAGNMVEATERLIEQHNSQWTMGGGRGLPTSGITAAAEAEFRDIESFSFDVATPYSHEAWRGRIRASAGVGASLSPAAVEAFDADLARLLLDDYPEDPLAVPHRCFAVISRAP
jgi:SAM-dependent methyltransferase